MPNNAKLFGTTHLTVGHAYDLLVALKCHVIMSVHCTCCICYLCCSLSGVVCASVDRGVEELLHFFDDSYYLTYQHGKRKSPSLCISLILCFPTSILSTIILHAIPCLLQIIRVSYQLHKFHIHYLFSFLISIGLLCWPEYHYICCYNYA